MTNKNLWAKLLQRPEFPTYMSTWYDTVANSFYSHESVCANSISAAYQELYNAMYPTFNAAYFARLQNDLALCSPVSSVSDAYQLLYWTKLAYSLLTEFNYPRPSVFYAVGAPLQAYCARVRSASPRLSAAAVVRLALDMYYNSTAGGKSPVTCYSNKATASQDQHLHSLFVPGIDAKPWSYQTCTQFWQPMAGGEKLFHIPHPYSFTSMVAYCQRLWGQQVPIQPYRFPLDKLNTLGHIAFMNGGYDPVSAFSILHSNIPNVFAIFTEDTAHTLDLFGPQSDTDPASIVDARNQALKIIQTWVAQYKPHSQQ